uniref:C2 domain-containing protein n=2 Tax=Cajanus cajan TaxID=3821 RepID=A0A151UCQ1_CAJCA|nr:hypothetical protein KK1_021294 [Cajanus cajan]
MRCENLRVTEEPYVVVRAESLNCCTTKMAKDNNSGLFSWNEKLMVKIPVHARSITFEVQCNRFKAVRPVGVARIAVSDFLAVSENSMHVFSYRLRDWEGKRNGVIHFAVRVPPVPLDSSNGAVEPVKETAVIKDSGDRFLGINAGDDKSNEVAVGCVPFWWNFNYSNLL